MGQTSIYLDDITEKRLQYEAKKFNCSRSKYISKLILNCSLEPQWPDGYWDLYGSLKDVSFEAPEDFDVNSANLYNDFAERNNT